MGDAKIDQMAISIAGLITRQLITLYQSASLKLDETYSMKYELSAKITNGICLLLPILYFVFNAVTTYYFVYQASAHDVEKYADFLMSDGVVGFFSAVPAIENGYSKFTKLGELNNAEKLFVVYSINWVSFGVIFLLIVPMSILAQIIFVGPKYFQNLDRKIESGHFVMLLCLSIAFLGVVYLECYLGNYNESGRGFSISSNNVTNYNTGYFRLFLFFFVSLYASYFIIFSSILLTFRKQATST